jgi:TubC N-terminal docking domain
VNAGVLLDDLRNRDVLLEPDGDRLIVDAPAGVVTEELRTTSAEHKGGLLRLLAWERGKLEEAQRRGFVARWSDEPGWIALHDPTDGTWHEVRAADCFPSIVTEANGNSGEEAPHEGKTSTSGAS